MGGVEVEVGEEGEVLRVEEEEEGVDLLMIGDLRGEMTGEGEGVMVGEMEVQCSLELILNHYLHSNIFQVAIETTTEEGSVVTGMEVEVAAEVDSRTTITPTLV